MSSAFGLGSRWGTRFRLFTPSRIVLDGGVLVVILQRMPANRATREKRLRIAAEKQGHEQRERREKNLLHRRG
jgi:hypothetical protein